MFVLSGKTWTYPRGIRPGGCCHPCGPVSLTLFLTLAERELLWSQAPSLPYTPRPALPGKGGRASLLAEIQPGQVLGLRGQRKGTLQGSSYFLRTRVPISLPHMIYWDILHVPDVSTSQKNASAGRVMKSVSLQIYRCRLRE